MKHQVLPPSPAQIEDARRVIADHLVVTPTVNLSIRGRATWAKLETLQPTGSFKIRGALAALDAARRSDPNGAVITSSAGNHGLGVAHAAQLLGVRATVVVPANASAAKVAKLRHYDIELIQIGSSYDDAQAHAKELSASRSIRYISPFNDTNVIAGQSTVVAEMLEQAPNLEHLVVSVGGGGLLSGCLIALDHAQRGDIRVSGVQPENSAALHYVLKGQAMADVRHSPTIADGLAGGGDEGSVTNTIIAEHKIPLLLVAEDAIRSAVRESAESSGLVLEGSASASYAAIALNLVDDTTSRIGFIASGRNISHELFVELLSESIH